MICRPAQKKMYKHSPISVVRLSGALKKPERQNLTMPQNLKTLAPRMVVLLHG
jgi:hypothetical protein